MGWQSMINLTLLNPERKATFIDLVLDWSYENIMMNNLLHNAKTELKDINKNMLFIYYVKYTSCYHVYHANMGWGSPRFIKLKKLNYITQLDIYIYIINI